MWLIHVAFSPRDVFDMSRVGQNQREIAIALDVPDRLPVDAARLHHDVRCAKRCEPLRQGQKLARRCLEGANLALTLPSITRRLQATTVSL